MSYGYLERSADRFLQSVVVLHQGLLGPRFSCTQVERFLMRRFLPPFKSNAKLDAFAGCCTTDPTRAHATASDATSAHPPDCPQPAPYTRSRIACSKVDGWDSWGPQPVGSPPNHVLGTSFLGMINKVSAGPTHPPDALDCVFPNRALHS